MDTSNLKNILLIDDEKPIAETISAYARKEYMEVNHVDNGEEGLKIFQQGIFDIILLDWMLPGMSGLEIIKRIREKSDIPILMLSARNDEADIVLGLEMGADDYITKPFGPRELIARIHSLLRRTHRSTTHDSDIICGDLIISFQKKELSKKGIAVKLTSTEFKILEALYSNREKVVSREELMVQALGYRDFLNDRTLDTHVKNLRKKIEDDPQQPQIIKTVRVSGFKFSVPHTL